MTAWLFVGSERLAARWAAVAVAVTVALIWVGVCVALMRVSVVGHCDEIRSLQGIGVLSKVLRKVIVREDGLHGGFHVLQVRRAVAVKKRNDISDFYDLTYALRRSWVS